MRRERTPHRPTIAIVKQCRKKETQKEKEKNEEAEEEKEEKEEEEEEEERRSLTPISRSVSDVRPSAVTWNCKKKLKKTQSPFLS